MARLGHKTLLIDLDPQGHCGVGLAVPEDQIERTILEAMIEPADGKAAKLSETVWQIANESDDEHPAIFPVEIPHRLIKLFTFWGDTVLDPFAGVGTTAKAATPLGRKAVEARTAGVSGSRARNQSARIR